MLNVGGVRGVVERQDIGFVEAERERAQNTRESGVVFECRIAEMLHPEKIIVERMIDAIFAAESYIDRRNSAVIEERAEIGTGAKRADGDIAIGHERLFACGSVGLGLR